MTCECVHSSVNGRGGDVHCCMGGVGMSTAAQEGWGCPLLHGRGGDVHCCMGGAGMSTCGTLDLDTQTV